MAAPSPSDELLRRFLLGTVSNQEAGIIMAWLDLNPANLARLEYISARDPILDALTTPSTDHPISSALIARLIQTVSGEIHAASPQPTASLEAETTGVQASVRGSSWPPAQIGSFRLLRALGHGAMGYVFQAEDTKLRRRVAVKLLAPEMTRQKSAVERFLREARAAATVEHENVVPILQVGEELGVPYLVMPLLKGESLARRLKRTGKLPPHEVVQVGQGIAAALAAAHARGLVHGGLKPANVWLDKGTNRARVLDIGLACLNDDSEPFTAASMSMGTPGYVAPEQIERHPANPRSDLFSLGATLYECVTGRGAFQGPTSTAVLHAVTTHDPLPPVDLDSNVPVELSALIMRLLAKNPEDRPRCAEGVLAALSTLDSSGLQASTPQPGRSRWAKVAVAIALGIGCALLFWLCLR